MVHTYPGVDPPGTGAEDVEGVKDGVEVRGLLQERVVLVDVGHTAHDGHCRRGRKREEEGGK